MRTIEYIPKATKATTEYRTLQAADKKWVMEKLRDIEHMRVFCEGSADTELKRMLAHLTKPTSKIPRLGTGGYNSIISAVDGILSNIEDGTQRDFSDKTCKIVESTFAHLHSQLPEWDLVEFVQVAEFTPQKKTTPKPVISSTDQQFSVLFGDYEIDVVIKSKRTIV
jgi:hypothetical protein